MTDPIYRLIYCSHVAEDSLGDTAGIFAVSRVNNARDGLTGALLHKEGLFAQILEGPLPVVERTFERIQCDPRHDNVVVLQFAEVGGRTFSDWAMADAGAAADLLASPLPTDLLARPANQAADDVLVTLRDLVNRQEDWAIAS